MKIKTLREACIALDELNNDKLPPVLAMRLGLNLNHVRPVFERSEEQRKKLIEAHDVAPDMADKPGYAKRLKEFTSEWDVVLEDEIEWSPAAKVPAKLLNTMKEFKNTAQLLAAGILIAEPIEE